MGSYLKIKKSKFIVTFLLIFNQLLISSYALENKEIVTIESEHLKSQSKYKAKIISIDNNSDLCLLFSKNYWMI